MSTKRFMIHLKICLDSFLASFSARFQPISPLFHKAIISTVKPVIETTCIKQSTAVRDHCSDTTLFLKSTLYDLHLKNTCFNTFPNKPWFLRVCSTSLLKTLWEKEKLLIPSNFSFSHSVFYPFGKLPAIFIEFEIIVCKLFQFGSV